MSGTIVISKGFLTGRTQKYPVKAILDGVKGEKVKGTGAVEVQLAPGSHAIQVRLGGFRTNKITIEVKEGVRHTVNISATGLEVLLKVPLFGILPAVLLAALPGSGFRLLPS